MGALNRARQSKAEEIYLTYMNGNISDAKAGLKRMNKKSLLEFREMAGYDTTMHLLGE